MPSVSSSRVHKHSRGSGRPPGRGFTGHKGRGSGRDYAGQRYMDPVGVEERPESAVDEPSDEEESAEGTVRLTDSSCLLYLPTSFSQRKMKTTLRSMFQLLCG